MSIPRFRAAALICLACAGLFGCKSNSPAERAATVPHAPTTAGRPAPRPRRPGSERTADNETVRDVVTETLKQPSLEGGNPPFPTGTRVRRVQIEDTTVTIDFNKKFDELKMMGESTESLAQRALRKALEPYSNLEKMRVTVDGKPFESEATDWNTPFPIRGEPSP